MKEFTNFKQVFFSHKQLPWPIVPSRQAALLRHRNGALMLSVPVVEGPIGLAGSLEKEKMAGYNLVGGFNPSEKY